MELTGNNVRLHLNGASEILACMAENARTSALVLIALVQMIIQALVANMNLMLVRLDYVKMAQHVLMTVKIIPASVPLGSKERTVTKISLTARKTLAHPQQRVLTYPVDSTANVLSISLETIAERVSFIIKFSSIQIQNFLHV